MRPIGCGFDKPNPSIWFLMGVHESPFTIHEYSIQRSVGIVESNFRRKEIEKDV
jgi:hypothetical protein